MLLPPATDALFKLLDEMHRDKSALPDPVLFQLRSLESEDNLIGALETHRAVLPRKITEALDRFNQVSKHAQA